MTPALAIAVCAVLGGSLATYLYDDDSPLGSRVCAGVPIGLAVLGLVGFILASRFGLGPLTLVTSMAAVLSPSILALGPSYRRQFKADLQTAWHGVQNTVRTPDRRTVGYVTFYVATVLLLWKIFDRAMFEGEDGIYTGDVHNLGDLPFHLSVIARFVYGNNIPPENPIYAGVSFTYSFLVDFVAALFVRAGATFREALLLENLLLAVSLVGLLHRWALELTRDRLGAVLTPALILLNGGLGWWLLVRDLLQGDRGVVATLASPVHDFTIGQGWRWGNSITTLLLPQRAFLLGLPLAIIVFTLWWRVTGESRQRAHPKIDTSGSSATRLMLAGGATAGLLPLVHAHTLLVVTAMAACLALLVGSWRQWIAFGAAAGAVALPQIVWSAYGSATSASSFFGWHVGWDRGDQNVLWFWFKNTGLVIPLTVAAFLWREDGTRTSRKLLLFYLPFTLCFVVPNLIRLSPWIWDNIKVLFYWYVASVPLVALVLARLWRAGRWHRATAIAALGSLTLAGGLDIWRVVSHASAVQVFSREGIAFATKVRETTPPDSLILHAPTYNHPVFLTGRRSLMGYPGHLWSHGLDYRAREADVKKMYEGTSESDKLLTRDGVDYVVVGPLERRLLSVNVTFFSRFPTVVHAGAYQLHDVSRSNR